ncbi:MAG: hypothetical protein NC084_05250 [Bacteroides sp.]|nr:hypothetical protein [Eubacterium sp.]MCM1418829.1 hypothetical protein [Roseburia sp.]MCM1462103.1 hypothetical protein [Bacteroides sp.]
MGEILFRVSAAAILTAAVKALVPSERYEKQFKILLSCFFLAATVGAFREGFGALDLPDLLTEGGYRDYSVQVEKMTADEIGAALKDGIRAALAEENISPEKIYVGVHISGETNISISEIRLVFKSADEAEKQRAVRITKGLVGLETAVIAEEDQRLSSRERDGTENERDLQSEGASGAVEGR